MIITRDTVGTYDRSDRSARRWNKEATRLFAARSDVHTIVTFHGGRKTDALPRGIYHAPPGHVYIIVSTGGRWGRPRRDFYPLATCDRWSLRDLDASTKAAR